MSTKTIRLTRPPVWQSSDGKADRGKRSRRRQGIAMLVVMVVAGAIGMLAITMLHVSRNNQLLASAEHQHRVARCAAQGAVHRGIAMLRRNPGLRGPVSQAGPEVNVGVVSVTSISTNLAGQIVISSTAQYQGAVSRQQIIVDPSRL